MSDSIAPMGAFFDSVAPQYDVVQTSNIDRGPEYYAALANPLERTEADLRLLDLGAGTGLDLVCFFDKMPNLRVDCYDLAPKLLEQLVARFKHRKAQIALHVENYLTAALPRSHYDLVLASATLHHFTEPEKEALMGRIVQTMKAGARLVVGDFYVDAETAGKFRAYYDSFTTGGRDVSRGQYHLDIPTTLESDRQLLERCDLVDVDVHWQSSNYAIMTAMRP